ncbi:MAG TPA: hypothetical protein VF071_12050 [Candidatus Limnocylindria bacterium]
MTAPRTPLLALLVAFAAGGCTPAAAEQAAVTLRPTETVVGTPSPTAGPTPPPTVEPTPEPTLPPAPPPAAPFAMNLFEEGDFVPQHTFDWCVGASIQMTWNLVRPLRRSSYEDQQALWEMARARSFNSFGGANPRGWASVLTEIGLGHYELVSVPEWGAALRAAASALRETNRPVGLVMWRGRHAWVMSGFESVGDPAAHDDFTVTGIRVLDPLYPHGSAAWGPSPAPNALLTPEQLAAQFVIRDRRHWSSDIAPGYLLVLPV